MMISKRIILVLLTLIVAGLALVGPVAAITVLYDGDVTLTPGGTIQVTDYIVLANSYNVDQMTALGALDAAGKAASPPFTYGAAYTTKLGINALVLDNVASYPRVSNSMYWYAYLNGFYRDAFDTNPADAVSKLAVAANDHVDFLYAPATATKADMAATEAVATAAVHIVVKTGETPSGWTLPMSGARPEIVTQAYFEDAITCRPATHYRTFTDTDGTWSGMPIHLLLGMVDDNPDPSAPSHYDYNEALALASGYDVKITGTTGTITLNSEDIANNKDGYIIANILNDATLTQPATGVPLRLKGSGAAANTVGDIIKIELVFPPPPAAEWNLKLTSLTLTKTITDTQFQQAIADGHYGEWIQPATATAPAITWSGVPLDYLLGKVDDTDLNTFSDVLAASPSYTVQVRDYGTDKLSLTTDDYFKDFQSRDIVAAKTGYIVANKKDGAAIPPSETNNYPIKLVGSSITSSGKRVGSIDEISLIPNLKVVKYSDYRGGAIAAEKIFTLADLKVLPVLGNGETYIFQGPTFDPSNLWDPDETLNVDPGKVNEKIKATEIKLLTDQVGGMTSDSMISVTDQKYETIMTYDNIYAPITEQGPAVLAWWAERQGEVPYYTDGYRLFFLTPDHVFGHTNMKNSVPAEYYHYFWQDNVQYPSAGGMSTKFVNTIEIYPKEQDWTIDVDGTRIGGIDITVDKAYFEEGMACPMGNHKGTFTNSAGKWDGMALWFLCGFADDENSHSANAYRDDLAQKGYDIIVSDPTDISTTIDSRDTIRNTDYIIANTLNGVHLRPGDSTTSWPLTLLGTGVVTPVESVKKISKITMNFRPTIDSLTLPTTPVVTGASVTAKAVFTDSYDTHTAVFDWGDGLTSSGVVDEKAQNVSGTHTYAKPGFYKVTLTLVDSMKVEATATSGKPVIVYDPKSGFVAGVGSISSPASAYTADPSLTGIATVELLARYPVVMKKDFTGVTAFQFVKAKKAFTSTSYDWLVIQREAKKAFYQGSGKINGKGNYAFLVSVIDGGSKPAQDRFRIKIWDKATGAIVYDTQPGDADTADPTTPLTKGILAIERFQ